MTLTRHVSPLLIGVVAVCGLTVGSSAGSELIGQGDHHFTIGQPFIADHVFFKYGIASGNLEPAIILFDLTVDASLIGVTLTADASNVADWDEVVALLTNGEQNSMYIYAALPGSPGASQSWHSETSTFFPGAPVETIDFEGFEIHSIELEFLGFTFETPGQDLLGDGIWTDWKDVELQISVYGEKIPAPGAALAFVGFACLHRRRARY